MVHLSIDIDATTKRRFKTLCAEHGDNMSDVLKRAIDSYISSKNVRMVKA